MCQVPHAEDGAVEEDVVAASEFRVEAGAGFEERGDAALDLDPVGGRRDDAGEDLEQRGFSRPVAADDPEDFALFDLEVDVLERPGVVGR